MIISTLVISEPDDATVCEGRRTVFTCVLNSNRRYSDILWYRFIKDTGTTEMVDPDDQSITIATHTESRINSSLTITNIRKSYIGYYWVATSFFNVCNVSLTVVRGMWIHFITLYVYTYIRNYNEDIVTFLNQACTSHKPVHTWLLKIVCVDVYMCVRLPPRLLITSGMIWTP